MLATKSLHFEGLESMLSHTTFQCCLHMDANGNWPQCYASQSSAEHLIALPIGLSRRMRYAYGRTLAGRTLFSQETGSSGGSSGGFGCDWGSCLVPLNCKTPMFFECLTLQALMRHAYLAGLFSMYQRQCRLEVVVSNRMGLERRALLSICYT